MTQYLGDSPALMTAERSSFSDAYTVANITTIAFIVDFVAGGTADRFFIDGMREAVFYRYYHCLLHLVTNNDTDPFLECHDFTMGNLGVGGGVATLFLHC